MPRNGLTIGGEDNPGEVVDRTRGRMLARYPLRIVEREGARPDRNNEMSMQEFARRIGEVERDLNGSAGLSCQGCQREKDEKAFQLTE